MAFDCAYELQTYLDMSTLIKFQQAFSEYSNKTQLKRLVCDKNNYEDLLYHIYVEGTECLSFIPFNKTSVKMFPINDSVSNYGTLKPQKLYEQYNLYLILKDIAIEHPDIVNHINKECFKNKMFVEDIEFWKNIKPNFV